MVSSEREFPREDAPYRAVPAPSPHARAKLVDLARLKTIAVRNAWLIAAVCAIALGIGFAITFLSTPLYRATASIQIDQQTEQILSDEEQPIQDVYDTERFLQTQLDILQSRTLALGVAQSLNLSSSPDFVARMTAGQAEPATDPAARLDQITGLLQGNLQASVPASSRIVDIMFVSPDAALARDIANAYVREFIRSNLQRKFDSSAYARDFLQDQLATTKNDVESAERALNDYARANGIVAANVSLGGEDGAGGTSLVGSSLGLNNAALSEARADRIRTEGRWRTVADAPLLNIPEVLQNSTVQTLLGQRAEAEAALREERTRHLPEHPSVIARQEQVSALTGQITSLAQNIRNSIRQDYQAAVNRESRLSQELASSRAATLQEQDASVQYNILAREAETARSLYASLLERYNELSATAGVAINNLSVVDYAQVPSGPYSPNLVFNLALALLCGLIAAAAIVLLREQSDEIIRSPGDLPRAFDIPLLGTVPLLREDADAATLMNDTMSNLSEAFASIRTSLIHSSPSGAPPVLFVTSPRPAEGKTLSSYALAASFAQLGKKTLLVVADLRRPSLHRLIAISNDRGLSDVLSGTAEAPDVVQQSEVPGLDIITAGSATPNPAVLLGGHGLRTFLAEQVRTYDVIVIDGPPVLGLADAPAISNLADGTIFLVEAGRSRRDGANAALQRLRAADAYMIGGILNRFVASKSGDSAYYDDQYYAYD